MPEAAMISTQAKLKWFKAGFNGSGFGILFIIIFSIEFSDSLKLREFFRHKTKD